MYFVYILKSLSTGKYYIGQTDNLTMRLAKHNSGQVKSTKSKRPWVIIYTEEFQTRTESYSREKKIKSWKSRKAIERLINNVKPKSED